MSEIEKYYNGEIHVDFDEDDLIGEIIEQHNEIERLKSIIKEVREYIVKNIENTTQKLDIDNMKCYNSALIELQEILDKENKDGER